MMLVWVGLGLLGVAEAINPGGFPNDITAPIRGWRSWNVRQPQSAPPHPTPLAAAAGCADLAAGAGGVLGRDAVLHRAPDRRHRRPPVQGPRRPPHLAVVRPPHQLACGWPLLTLRRRRDLGFTRVGIDSGWASCTGVNGSWHDETGHFIINTTRFPNMKAMVRTGSVWISSRPRRRGH